MRTAIACCGMLSLMAAGTPLRRGATVRAQDFKPTGTNLKSGKLIYDEKCEPCHFSTSSERKIGPGLAGLMKRAKFKDGLTANDENLRRVIQRGGKDMPGFRNSLKEKQVRDLIAYVKML
ncbi:MAG TPA: cytochrome c [Candidatus Acidoferrales bacterium]|nr:cytochrome c [Candidatus Acidoferrales bacterium]